MSALTLKIGTVTTDPSVNIRWHNWGCRSCRLYKVERVVVNSSRWYNLFVEKLVS